MLVAAVARHCESRYAGIVVQDACTVNDAAKSTSLWEYRTLNSYFESREQAIDFARYLAQGEVPLKFAYAGSGAGLHERFARSLGYKAVVHALPEEVRALADAVRPPADLFLCDIGPGTGAHSTAFVSAMLELGYQVDSYLALDYSAELLGLAMQRFAHDYPRIGASSAIWDIEEGGTNEIANARQDGQSALLCLLGNTLGNAKNPASVLTNLRSACSPGDRLLVSVALLDQGNDEDSILSPYRTTVFEDAALEPLVAGGIPRGALRLDVSLEQRTVIGTAQLLKDASVLGSTFQRGDTIRCFRSQRFLPDELGAHLNEAGWATVSVRTAPAGSHEATVAVPA